MFCNYCRALNPNDAVYCSACGRTVKSSVENEEDKTGNPAKGLPQASKERLEAASPAIPSSVAESEIEESSSCGQVKEAAHQESEGSLGSDSHQVPDPSSTQSSLHTQTAGESKCIVAKRDGASGWVIMGVLLATAIAMEATFLAVRQTSNKKAVELLTKSILSAAFAGSGLLWAISGRWLTLKRVFLIAGVAYVGALSCLLFAFPSAPAGDRLLEAMRELNSIGEQIGHIENREYHNPQDHIDALLQVEPLVRKWRQALVDAEQASSRLSPSPDGRQNPQFQEMFSLLNDGVSLKEQEVALAHKMQDLPPDERQQFLDTKLMPLFRHEIDLQNRAVQLQKKN